jgi:thiosulfate reductase/polysulfide reductase chain A
MPAANPKYNSMPSYWMARQLALKLGLEAYFPHENIEELLDWQLKQIGSSLEEMIRIGVKTFPRASDNLYFYEDEDVEFLTNTGKIELFATSFVNEGFDGIPCNSSS